MKPGCALKGRRSVQPVALIIVDAVSDQDLPEFVLEAPGPMVFVLPFNVIDDRLSPRCVHRKDTVSSLPGEFAQVGKGLVDPTGRVRLQVPHQVGDPRCGLQFNQKMHVILDTVQDDDMTEVTNDRHHVGKQSRLHIALNPSAAALGGKNDMKKNL
jgi:hypothetical protein